MATWRVPTKEELQMAAAAGHDTRHLMANRDVTDGVVLLDLKTRMEIKGSWEGDHWKVTVFPSTY